MEAIHLDGGSKVISILGKKISWERIKGGRISPVFFSFDALKWALENGGWSFHFQCFYYALCIFVDAFSNILLISLYSCNWERRQRKLGRNKLMLLINKQT